MMAKSRARPEEEAELLAPESASTPGRQSMGSVSSVSTTSLVLEELGRPRGRESQENSHAKPTRSMFDSRRHTEDFHDDNMHDAGLDEEDAAYVRRGTKADKMKAKKFLWTLAATILAVWLVALTYFVSRQSYRHSSSIPHDPLATMSRGTGKKVTMDEVLGGTWRAKKPTISWIAGPNGEDGLLLEKNGVSEKGYLVVEDVRAAKGKKRSEELAPQIHDSRILMKKGSVDIDGAGTITPNDVKTSPDLKSVLLISEKKSNWRHSFYGNYWIFDVASQTGQALDPSDHKTRIQHASWSPSSDAVAFTRENNMYFRELSSKKVRQITKDGGTELFYGIPDWVYEEEVFSGPSATWWADDGKFIAFLRTNESAVPEYPIQYFVSRPSGTKPPPGEESYPEVRQIKYPKAGAPNPTVDLQFYDVEKDEVFSVEIEGDFPDPDRLITEVIWAGSTGKVLIKETNRESDVLRVTLIDVKTRTGKVVRVVDVNKIDNGWFEVSTTTTYVPANESNSRPHDGYIDTIIHEGYDHLAYFTPLDNPDPILLTSGPWEVDSAPSAVDLSTNLVYFVGTREAPIQRHIYSVQLDGKNLTPLTDTSTEGYYGASFSTGAGYALVAYDGPDVPWERVMSTVGYEHYEDLIEDNQELASLAAAHELPLETYSNVTIDGFELQVVERRPPHFNPKKRYPVLFYLYGGPGSQTVSKAWKVDFQSYVASSLGYIVVTVDGRGTGYIGRKARCIVRGNIGYYEAHDQIETAKIWADKPYVDASRIAIWGWSYGGFMTLKTLEQDAGQTFQYGMAVAPVTDWKFYDSIYTERYMHTPQNNPDGYHNASIHNVTALGENVRFLLMHGVADDNVHMQHSLTLLDQLDLAGIENYDVHVFPDSDHSIGFHNANRMVYDRLNNWLINAFNGEWLRTGNAVPLEIDAPSRMR